MMDLETRGSAVDAANDRGDRHLGSFEIKADQDDENDQRYLVHNRTPHEMRLRLPNAESELRLAPLGERLVRGARLKPYEPHIVALREAHLLRVRTHHQSSPSFISPQLLAGLGFAVAVTLLILVFYTTLGLNHALTIWLLCLSGGAVVGAAVMARAREHTQGGETQAVDREEGDIMFRAGGEFSTGNDFNRTALDVAVLLGTLAVGAVGPAAAVYYGTDLRDYVNFDGKITLTAGQEGRVISRLIQICYLGVLSLFPALMFFQFDRQRVGTIRGRWVQAIFRIDPKTRSLADVHARYGDEISDASHHSADSIHVLGGRRSPLIVATILVTLGWTILILRTDSFDFQATSDAEQLAATANEQAEQAEEQAAIVFDESSDLVEQAAAVAEAEAASAAAQEAQQQLNELANDEAAEAGETTTATADSATTPTTSPPVTAPSTREEAQTEVLDDSVRARLAAEQAEQDREAVSSTGFFQLLNPRPSAAGMAFLGAYFYAVYLVLHGYYRSDLRPKIYNQITARLAVVVVVAYLISVTLSSVVPDGIIWTVAFLAGVMPRQVVMVITDRIGQFSARLAGASGEAFSDRLSLTEIEGIHLWERDRLVTEGIGDLEALAHSNVVATMVQGRLQEERMMDWVDQALLLLHLRRENGKPRAIEDLRGIAVRNASSVMAAAASPELRPDIQKSLQGQPLGLLESALTNEPNYKVVEQWRASSLNEAIAAHRTFYDIDGVLRCEHDPGPCEVVATEPGT